jgi:hypothetical protein
LRDEGLGLVGERVVEADFVGLRHLFSGKETMIVSEGTSKTNRQKEKKEDLPQRRRGRRERREKGSATICDLAETGQSSAVPLHVRAPRG